MSNWGYDDADNSQAGNNLDGPKALRDAYDKLKEQNEALNSKLTSFLEEQQNQKLDAVFENLGAPGARQHYKGEADPAKIEEWVTSMKSVFGGTQVAPATDTQPVIPAITPDQQSAFQSFVDAGTSAESVTRYEAARSEITGKSPEEILAFWTGGKA